ncbi:NAD-dependent epimerase/dehydratase family protein [Dactylosporangium siamense]|uniref:UDP-glucose 4-epimerase n=1 Tax=Dactylosporangium siamense TaxID=685454 RepID=A0A919PP14_9ACTN|nr:NAD-dependent epimerase/dehydratase family protein [Dactylosporangium siamense]GIG48106.1 UDP-glucose 4-epimerase GalE [Dactylosporangium siamense]
MRILVTGAGGFVGRAVCLHLELHGHAVLPWPSRLGYDLTDTPSVKAWLEEEAPIDAVVHLAAKSTVRESWQDPAGYYATNLGGTANLVSGLRLNPGHPVPVVFASTSAVYGPDRDGSLSEDLDARPTNPYAATKAAAEQLLHFEARAGNIGVTTLRLFNVAGGYNGIVDSNPTRIINNCLRAAAGVIPHVSVNGDGSARREFTHVTDVAEAFRLAVETTKVGDSRTYNVGTGVGVSMREVIDATRAVTGVDFEVVHNPPVDEPQMLVADVSRVQAELGWTPERSTLEQVVVDAWRFRSLAS